MLLHIGIMPQAVKAAAQHTVYEFSIHSAADGRRIQLHVSVGVVATMAQCSP